MNPSTRKQHPVMTAADAAEHTPAVLAALSPSQLRNVISANLQPAAPAGLWDSLCAPQVIGLTLRALTAMRGDNLRAKERRARQMAEARAAATPGDPAAEADLAAAKEEYSGWQFRAAKFGRLVDYRIDWVGNRAAGIPGTTIITEAELAMIRSQATALAVILTALDTWDRAVPDDDADVALLDARDGLAITTPAGTGPRGQRDPRHGAGRRKLTTRKAEAMSDDKDCPVGAVFPSETVPCALPSGHAPGHDFKPAEHAEPEGWGVIRPGDRKAHYYRQMTSLCRRVGFYLGSLEADEATSRDDCTACRKVLDREKAKAANAPAS